MNEILIEYTGTAEEEEFKQAIEAIEDEADNPYSDEDVNISGWWSSVKKYAKKAVKSVAKAIVPAPVRKILSVADKATGGMLSGSLPTVLKGLASMNPITGAITSLSTKMFDDLDKLGKHKGKQVKFTAKATGNVARTFYQKGRSDSEEHFLKKIYMMTREELKLMHQMAKTQYPKVEDAKKGAFARIAKAQGITVPTPTPKASRFGRGSTGSSSSGRSRFSNKKGTSSSNKRSRF